MPQPDHTPSAATVGVKRGRSLRHELSMARRHGWWWKRTFYWPAARAWARLRYGVKVPPGMMAQLGRGRFVDVIQRGPYVEITEHASGDMIRVIPYQPNHGFMVELHTADGRMPWRTHLDFKTLRGMGIGEQRGS